MDPEDTPDALPVLPAEPDEPAVLSPLLLPVPVLPVVPEGAVGVLLPEDEHPARTNNTANEAPTAAAFSRHRPAEKRFILCLANQLDRRSQTPSLRQAMTHVLSFWSGCCAGLPARPIERALDAVSTVARTSRALLGRCGTAALETPQNAKTAHAGSEIGTSQPVVSANGEF
jgi:hypothetical protein